MRGVLLVMGVLAVACGCTRQEQAQQQLITQLESGVKQIGEYCDGRQQIINEHYRQRRAFLDDAFDEDVRDSESLDAAWVIEHRKAYAAGMEAIWNAQRASEQAHEHAMTDLAAINDGLERLRWISEMRENWGKAFEDVQGEVRK